MASAEPIVLGQRFDSLQDFKHALRLWAVEACFTPAILDSDSRRVRVGCRSSKDCPFRIRCNFNVDGNYANVTIFEGAHTCASASGRRISQNIKRAEVTRLKFLLSAVPHLMQVTPETTTKSIIDVVQEQYGQKIALRQAQKVKAMLARNASRLCERCDEPHYTGHMCSEGQITRLRASNALKSLEISTDQASHSSHIINEPSMLETESDMSIADHGMPGSPSSDGEPEMQVRCSAHDHAAPNAQPVHSAHKSALEVRNDAARLMKRASELIEEAARLNAEAARLTASVAEE